MTLHLTRDLDGLKKDILTMGALVEEAANKAINALVDRNATLADEVVASDEHIDHHEVEVEEECLKLLALHQPVAVDLRFIITCLKVNNDLERMGDLAVNIAERARYLAKHPPISLPADLPRMAERVRNMVRDSLDALVRQDPELAENVRIRDDEVDNDNRHLIELFQEQAFRDPTTVKRAIAAMSCSRYLERIADHATNIAEDVIFMCKGAIVRHLAERFDE